MRDPKRIERMAALLVRRWKQDPDQRLTQLLVNVLSDAGRSPTTFFHVEDTVVEEALVASLPPASSP